MGNENKSVIKEAILEYNMLKEAADSNAKKKLANEFPEKYNEFLKEELNKKNNKKESYKKLDESKESVKDENLNKESVMKSQVKETKKVVKENSNVEETVTIQDTVGDGKPFDEKAKKSQKVDETITIQDTVGDTKPFDEKAKKSQNVEETVTIQDTVGDGKPFDEKAKKSQKVDETITIQNTVGDTKPFDEKAKKSLQTEEFNITELDVNDVGTALESADDNDEILTMEEIENEIANMSTEPSPAAGDNKGDAYTELIGMRDKLNEILGNLGEMHNQGSETYGSSTQVAQQHAQGPTDELIDEEPDITDADIDAVLGGKKEGEVDEAHGLAYSVRRPVSGRNLPSEEHLSAAELDQAPYLAESKKKINSLIEENKKLTKKLNENKKFKESATTLIESYKSALEKYRNQLKEMAIFNTNLAHVNNLLVNEELALTQDDKIKIINEFKVIKTITASQEKYKNLLGEMKEGKKTLTESIESKVSASIQPSSKQKLNEVVEKTAYENNEHINKMKKFINYIERNDKK